jgi:thiamine-phosphate pyrophosphorylase
MTSLDPRRLRLVVITDAGIAHPRSVVAVVTLALEAGAPCIQLRDKHLPPRDLFPLALQLRSLTRGAGALLILNDRVDLALAVEADGVHLGPDDLPVREVRRVVPADFLIGYSTHDPGEARRAVDEGADYLGVGAVWPTSTKVDAGETIGPEGVARVATDVSVPIVAIGGITLERAPLLLGSGATGIAVIGAVMGAREVAAAVRNLLSPTEM